MQSIVLMQWQVLCLHAEGSVSRLLLLALETKSPLKAGQSHSTECGRAGVRRRAPHLQARMLWRCRRSSAASCSWHSASASATRPLHSSSTAATAASCAAAPDAPAPADDGRACIPKHHRNGRAGHNSMEVVHTAIIEATDFCCGGLQSGVSRGWPLLHPQRSQGWRGGHINMLTKCIFAEEAYSQLQKSS